MLVIFSSKAYHDITMFGDVAKRLLLLMGQSGVVPGAINAEDVPAALAKLQAAISDHSDEAAEDLNAEEQGRQQPINIHQRAFPLLEMLTAAAADEASVKWLAK